MRGCFLNRTTHLQHKQKNLNIFFDVQVNLSNSYITLGVSLPHIVFFHGLENGPHGSKFHQLVDSFGDVISPDFTGVLDIHERLCMAEEALKDIPEMFIVGSSFGGLLAVLFANKHPDRVLGYVLCAPAVHRLSEDIHNVPLQASIIHGNKDSVVPLAASQAFASQHNISLIVVDDDHPLSLSGQVMISSLKAML